MLLSGLAGAGPAVHLSSQEGLKPVVMIRG
jgi:hypothetical protein